MKLDYGIRDAQGRLECVRGALAEDGRLSPQALSYMADYLLFVQEPGTTKAERSQEYPVVTRNREVTVSKRQVSYDELAERDGPALAVANDKGQIMDPRDPVTQRDIDEVPGMREKAELVEDLKRQASQARGRRRYLLKRQLISTCQEQYVLKAAWRGGARVLCGEPRTASFDLPPERVRVGEDGFPRPEPGSVSLMDPAVVSAVLSGYAGLRFPSDPGALGSDSHLAAMDLERLLRAALPPLLYDVARMKVCGCSNEEIAGLVRRRHGVSHFHRYYSTLWRRRIPRLVARRAQEEYVMRHHDEMGYTEYKVCPRCGRRLLAHPMFFSRNTSTDGYYSICKRCRSRREEGVC